AQVCEHLGRAEVARVDDQVGGAHASRHGSGSRRSPRGRWGSAIRASGISCPAGARSARAARACASGRRIPRGRLTERRWYTNICSMPVICALIPRFRLIAAIETASNGLLLASLRAPSHRTRPAALAPEPGAAQLIGEVSPAAEKFGLRAGMRM